MVEDLSARTSKTQLANRVGVNVKEISRWIRGAKPHWDHADALRKECENNGINPRKYESDGFKPIYVFQDRFEQNTEHGPGWIPPEPVYDLPKIKTHLWGFSPDSPIGIPACVLTSNSKWIVPLSKRGFDIISYKTVRSKSLSCHPYPNLAYVPDLTIPQPIGSFPQQVSGTHDSSNGDLGTFSLANSFGMPSDEPAVWQADMVKTRESMALNQVLIASVVGTDGNDGRDLVADFVRVAKLAAECNPHAIELNFSCPNVYGKEGSIYHNPELAERICKKVAKEIGDIRLIAKIGYLSQRPLELLFNKISRHVDGIAAINTFSAAILSKEGQCAEPLFPGDKRKNGGISGIAIREHALGVIRDLRNFAKLRKSDLVILGMGGVSGLDDLKQFIASGANAVQICTAAMFNPLIAMEIRKQWSGQSPLCGSPALADPRVKFTDTYVAGTMTRAIEVARDNLYPADEVLDCVQKHYVRPYKEKFADLNNFADAPVKARALVPTAGEIKEKYLHDKSQKINAKLSGTARVQV